MRLAAALLLTVLASGGWAAESWQRVAEDAAASVWVDMASLARQNQQVVFRERHILIAPQVDPESLRKVSEIQYRRLADCKEGKLTVLSRAVFADNNALVQYRAVLDAKASLHPPQSDLDRKVLVTVCGAA
jgi:hypothetical protein